jgi:4-nitrophenyl phosphatase
VKPNFIGKPTRNMIDVISKVPGIPNEQICAVGDRRYTDIAVAKNAGSVSVCVLSGESSEADIAESEVKPDYVLKDVAEIAKILRAAQQ